MFSWLKKRCRRKSAPFASPEAKRLRQSSSNRIDLQVPSNENTYFTLEDESDYHIYEDIDEVQVDDAICLQVTSTPSSSRVADDDVWQRQEMTLCPLCRVSAERSCDCITSDLDVTASEISSPFANNKRHRRTLQGHEISRLTRSFQHERIVQRRTCLLSRNRSDIQDRPLPDIPVRITEHQSTFDDDSSGYYDNLGSDSDIYEDINEEKINKCTTV